MIPKKQTEAMRTRGYVRIMEAANQLGLSYDQAVRNIPPTARWQAHSKAPIYVRQSWIDEALLTMYPPAIVRGA